MDSNQELVQHLMIKVCLIAYWFWLDSQICILYQIYLTLKLNSLKGTVFKWHPKSRFWTIPDIKIWSSNESGIQILDPSSPVRFPLFKWFAIQMPGTMEPGIWILDWFSNGGPNTSPLIKWWSEYWTSMVLCIWTVNHSTSKQIHLIWIPN